MFAALAHENNGRKSSLTSHSRQPPTKAAAPFSVSRIEPVSLIGHPLVQRKSNCACGGGCPNCAQESLGVVVQRKCGSCEPGAPCDSCDEEMIQRKAVTADRSASVAQASAGLNSSGSQLSETTRAHFEPLLGHDLSAVRVHTDADAINAARAVNAHAFTIGQRIAFDAGRYSPNSNEGRH